MKEYYYKYGLRGVKNGGVVCLEFVVDRNVLDLTMISYTGY